MQSANDWANLDPSKNMTLAEADQFVNQLGTLVIQFGEIYVRTQFGQIVSEADLRANNFLSPLPVNLCGHLVSSNQEVNLADFRRQIRHAAASDDPTGSLALMLQQILGANVNVAAMFTRIPAVQNVIASALKKI